MKRTLLAIGLCSLTMGIQASVITVDVLSQGFDAGNGIHVNVNGVDQLDYSSGARGFNIVVIDPVTGIKKSSQNFDIYGIATTSGLWRNDTATMVQYINQIKTGDFVVVAVQDTPIWDGSNEFSPSIAGSLMSLGGSNFEPTGYRSAYALIGQKGNGPGTALYGYAPAGNGNTASVYLDTTLTLSTVPEPSTCLAGLAALGMLGLFGWRNRK